MPVALHPILEHVWVQLEAVIPPIEYLCPLGLPSLHDLRPYRV